MQTEDDHGEGTKERAPEASCWRSSSARSAARPWRCCTRRRAAAKRASILGEKAREGRERATEAAEKGREVINQGRETLTTAIERGREAYQQARARENA